MPYDIAIIGGGPAGLAAACYALQAQLRVALIAPSMGGKVSYPFQLRDLPAVESVRGAELVQQFAACAEAKATCLTMEARTLTVTPKGDFQLTLEDGEEITARTVILAAGAQPQRLYVPGEREYMGRGVSFSAVSQAQFFRDRAVAVVGGERALEAVVKLAAFAKHVYYILARERELAPSGLAERAMNDPKIAIFRQWEVQSISGDDFVTHLNLVGLNGETRALAVEGVFVELGLLPNSALVRDLVVIDEAGRVAINQHCETSVPGLFAAGDVTNVYAEQVPVALGEGVKAALSAWSYLATLPRRDSPAAAAGLVASNIVSPSARGK
jgi:thioredoxin reductase